MENPLLLRVVTLCDVDHRISDITASPVDFVFCLGDLEDVWMANRVEALNPRYGAYGIRGNHDVNAPFPSNIEDLNFMNKAVVVDGRRVRLAGVPGSWRYKPYGTWLFYQDEISEMTDAMEAADILISHNCPANIGHERPCESLAEDTFSVHQGFLGINDYISAKKPQFLFHGHQHLHKTTQIQETVVIGCYGETLHEIPL